ncbi:hypothetical protein GGF31_007648 [Allomyces arbusculus]|nr:hypothetical protein GGF31_007648 [Allomyces arbusculus]
MTLYATTTWRAVRLFYAKRSLFFASILVLVALQLFDIIAALFYLRVWPPSLALIALDSLATAASQILFAFINLQRYHKLGGYAWPRVTNVFILCTAVFTAYWTALTIYGWVVLATNGLSGDWMLAVKLQGGNTFRVRLPEYVMRAQLLLAIEAIMLIVANIVLVADPTIDPMNLLGYLGGAVRMAAYCALLELLAKIMARREPTRETGAAAAAHHQPVRSASSATHESHTSLTAATWSVTGPEKVPRRWTMATSGSGGKAESMRSGVLRPADTFAWSPSTCIFTLILVLYATTTWNAVHLFWRKRSRFYASMLVLIVTQLYDMIFSLFLLYGVGATPAQMVLDYLACATFTVLFSVLNFLRFRQFGGSSWPRATKFLGACTVVLSVYWAVHMLLGWYLIGSTGHYGNFDYTNQMFAAGYLYDAALNAALSTAFLVQLRAMTRGNVFRAGLQHYVTKAQLLLVLESVSLAAVLALQLIDPTVDPIWLLVYFAQAIRMAAYCTLLHLLTRIMAPAKSSSPGGRSTSFSTEAGSGAEHSATNTTVSMVAAASTRIGAAAPTRHSPSKADGVGGG